MRFHPVIEEDLEYICKAPVRWETFRNKKILITGVSGLIGSYLACALLYAGRKMDLGLSVCGIVRSREKARKKFGALLDEPEFHMLYGDVARGIPAGSVSEDSGKTLPDDGQYEFIIHAASQTSPKAFTETPVDTILTNFEGTKNLLEYGRTHGMERFLLLSTREIYGASSKKFVTEEEFGAMDPSAVRSCYPESKRLSETLCSSYRAQFGTDCRVVRIAHTYGPGMVLRDGRVVGDFLGNVVDGTDIVMNSDGSGLLALTYIADIVTGILLSLTAFTDTVYNISDSSHIISVRELAETLCGLFPEKGIKAVFKPADEKTKAGYLKASPGFLDSAKAMREGWDPEISVSSGMLRTVRYFSENAQ